MDKIVLSGMQFRAFHGYYAEEQKIGNDFEVDVEVQASLRDRVMNDDLRRTYNYEVIYKICKEEMEESQRLIETVAERILSRVQEQCPFPAAVVVRVRKMRPLLGGPVQWAEVSLSGMV